MIRAVLDANVFASGVLRYDASTRTPGAILRAWAARSFELVTSDALIAEIERTLAHHISPLVSVATSAINSRQRLTRTLPEQRSPSPFPASLPTLKMIWSWPPPYRPPSTVL